MHKQIQLLKENGFAVYQNPSCPTYVFYIKNDLIGYLQQNINGTFNISTVHQANKTTGTGFQVYDQLVDPTIEQLEKGAFIVAPAWASAEDIKATKKYPSFHAFMKSGGSFRSQMIQL